MSHTKEPWKVAENAPGYGHRVIQDGNDRRDVVIGFVTYEDGVRIAACVNALAGIKNPAAVKELIEETRKFWEEWNKHRLTPVGPIQKDPEFVPGSIGHALAALDQEPKP